MPKPRTKAAVLNNIGNINNIEKNLLLLYIPTPELHHDEVLVEVKYAALNHRDLWISKGLYAGIQCPFVLGSDCSGIVIKTGKDAKKFKNMEVIVNPSLDWGTDETIQGNNYRILGLQDNGTFAEFVQVNKSNIYKKPTHLDFAAASAIPLAGLTAYRTLFVKAGLKKGDNILITGIGGGVSTFALLFAIKSGANVFVTSGKDDKIKKAISLGAKSGSNYNNPDWDKEIIELSKKNIDVIIDGAGGDTFTKCLNIINPGGKIVNYGATLGNVQNFEVRKVFWKQVSIFGTTMGSDKNFAEMINFIEKNKIKPIIDKIFDFKNIHLAFRRMDEASQFGKIVVKI